MSGVMVLYGVTDRDPDERVCQLFPNTEQGNTELESFIRDLPGSYDLGIWEGIDYDAAQYIESFPLSGN